MEMKHRCEFTPSIPLTSWSEALLLLLLVDVLPLSRLAGLEAEWKIRRHHDEQHFKQRTWHLHILLTECSEDHARPPRLNMAMGTKWFLTDQKVKEFPGSPRGHFRKGHYRNSEVQRRGKKKECSLELKLLSGEAGLRWRHAEAAVVRSLTTNLTGNPAQGWNAMDRRSKSICTDKVLYS